MFKRGKEKEKTHDINAETLTLLASTYRDYVARDWRHNKEGVGAFLLNYCLTHEEAFKTQVLLIGEGLLKHLPEANEALKLFEHIYFYGFSGERHKARIHHLFKMLLPEELMDQLDNQTISMRNVLKTWITDERALRLYK